MNLLAKSKSGQENILDSSECELLSHHHEFKEIAWVVGPSGDITQNPNNEGKKIHTISAHWLACASYSLV